MGTAEGARKAREKMIKKHGEGYYAEIGAIGGRAKVFKGFAMDKERASKAGRLGGSISRKNGTLTEAERQKIRKTHISLLDSEVPLIELEGIYIEDDSVVIDLGRSHWWNRRKI